MKTWIKRGYAFLLAVIVLICVPGVKAVGTGVFEPIRNEKFEMIELGKGFTIPMLSTEDGKYENILVPRDYPYRRSRCVETLPIEFFNSAYIIEIDQFAETREAALAEYEKWNIEDDLDFEKNYDIEYEIIEINNYPMMIKTSHNPGDPKRTMPEQYGGNVVYARNNCLLVYTLCSLTRTGEPFENVPPITKEDLIYAAEMMEYDSSKAPITVADGEITVTSKDGENTVSGGKRIKLSAAFANPEKVNRKARNDAVEWKVVDRGTHEETEYAVIDKNGNLSVNAKLPSPLELEVTASSPIFHTETAYRVNAIPALKKLTIEPANLVFYAGEDTAQSVKAVLEPETVPSAGLTWTAGKEGIFEIAAKDDGTAEIKPLAAGKAALTVKAPDGKSAKANVSVLEPVTGFDVVLAGTPKAGATVTLKASLEPKNAGNKAVEWSVNVGEEIATINQKGQLKIAKDVEAGTIIIVTCRALGASEPIEKQYEVGVH